MKMIRYKLWLDHLEQLPKSLEKEVADLKIGDHPNYNIKICKNTKESPGYRPTFAVAQIQVNSKLNNNNNTKIFRDFDILTDHAIQVRRSDLVLIHKKRIYHLLDNDVTTNHRMKVKKGKKLG